MAKVVLSGSSNLTHTQNDIGETVKRALDRLNFDFNRRIKKVVIKPNLCYYWKCSTGETTDPKVVSSVIDYVRERVGTEVDIMVAESDASAMKTKFAFTILGYDKLCQAKRVKLLNLSEGRIQDVAVSVHGKDLVLPINEVLLNADLIINVPKVKTHNFVGATCSLKNIFGAISKPKKYDYHKMISHVIVGANKIVRSHIVVVDGFICKGACTKRLGAVLAGDDALATDFIAFRIMGFNPRKIAHLDLAEREGIGQAENIELVEDIPLSDLRKNFPRRSLTNALFSRNLQMKLLRAYALIADDIVPPFAEK